MFFLDSEDCKGIRKTSISKMFNLVKMEMKCYPSATDGLKTHDVRIRKGNKDIFVKTKV